MTLNKFVLPPTLFGRLVIIAYESTFAHPFSLA